MSLVSFCAHCGGALSDGPYCPHCGRHAGAGTGVDDDGATPDLGRLPPGLALAGALGLLVGSVLPWATFEAPIIGTVTKNGIDGDGVITAVLALLALVGAVGLWNDPHSRLGMVWLLLVGLSAGTVGVVDVLDIRSRFKSAIAAAPDIASVHLTIGAGLVLVIAGAVVLVAAAGVAWIFEPIVFDE